MAGPEAGSFLSPSSCFATESVMMMKHCSVGGSERPNRPAWASLCMQESSCQLLQARGISLCGHFKSGSTSAGRTYEIQSMAGS